MDIIIPLIKVNHIRVKAVSFASVYQIGLTHSINSEARIKTYDSFNDDLIHSRK
ncbi:spore germination protein GerPE [Anaerobacillus sp. HL2]|nr:spore germination protein GerPE [Anaerobacillus sp. HL2]